MNNKISNFKFLNSKLLGYTLIELLIFMGMFSVILVVLTNLIVSITESRLGAESTSSVEEDGKYILNRLSYDVSRSNITQPANDGDNSTSLILAIGGVNYTYSLNGANLELENDLGTNNLNSTSTAVSALDFKRIGNSGDTKDTIQVTFTLTSNIRQTKGPEVRNYQTTVGVR